MLKPVNFKRIYIPQSAVAIIVNQCQNDYLAVLVRSHGLFSKGKSDSCFFLEKPMITMPVCNLFFKIRSNEL